MSGTVNKTKKTGLPPGSIVYVDEKKNVTRISFIDFDEAHLEKGGGIRKFPSVISVI